MVDENHISWAVEHSHCDNSRQLLPFSMLLAATRYEKAKEADMNIRSMFPGVLAMLATVMPALALAQTSSPTIEQRLRRVEDELAIRRILVDYAARQDARDYAGYAALFAKNGEWVNGKNVYKGREAILKMLVDLYGPPP